MKEPKLTAEELEAAKQAGKTPAEWRALKKVRTIEDWQALQRHKAKRGSGRAA